MKLPPSDRLIGGITALLVQTLLGWGLIAGLATDWRRVPEGALAVFRVAPPLPPPPIDPPRRREARQHSTRPAGPSSRARPVVSPPPIVPLQVTSTIIAAASPSTGIATTGTDAAGNGRRGIGGGSGVGTGVGTGAQPRQIRGEIRDADYPKVAARENRSGGVDIRYLVGTDGRISRCEVVSSSGSTDLDETACRLARARFRFEPATDASGRPMPAWVEDGVDWVNHAPPTTP